MKVHVYEKAWIAISVALLVAFAGCVVFVAAAHGIHPPSQVETIDPTAVMTDPRFTKLGVQETHDGVDVVMIAQLWSYIPGEVHVPANRPVTFRLTSPDVIHGFEIVGTNANAMILPGYVTQLTTTFAQPGEYLLLCNEYCGLAHHTMMGKIVAVDATRLPSPSRMRLPGNVSSRRFDKMRGISAALGS